MLIEPGIAKIREQATTPAAFTVRDFCQALSISRSHLYSLVKQGRIRIVKVGGRTLVPSAELRRLLGPSGNAEGSE
jgi:excisionase family DNA binding protein